MAFKTILPEEMVFFVFYHWEPFFESSDLPPVSGRLSCFKINKMLEISPKMWTAYLSEENGMLKKLLINLTVFLILFQTMWFTVASVELPFVLHECRGWGSQIFRLYLSQYCKAFTKYAYLHIHVPVWYSSQSPRPQRPKFKTLILPWSLLGPCKMGPIIPILHMVR